MTDAEHITLLDCLRQLSGMLLSVATTANFITMLYQTGNVLQEPRLLMAGRVQYSAQNACGLIRQHRKRRPGHVQNNRHRQKAG